MKKFSIILIILMFIAFIVWHFYSRSTLHVIQVYSPDYVALDLNKNGKVESNEKFHINGIETFYAKNNEEQKLLAEKSGVPEEIALSIGYFAEKYAQSLLDDKEVKVKTFDNNEIEISYDGKNYNKMFQSSPFALSDGKPLHQKEFEKQIQLAKNMQLKIYNNKSNKYHHLTCEYGQIAHDSVILPKKQIPAQAQECKFCQNLTKKDSSQTKAKVEKEILQTNIAKNIKPQKFLISSGEIKLFLTDLTTVLIPNNKCTTDFCIELVKQINTSEKSIDMALYGYTEIPEISLALQNAIKRGVNVRLVYDVDVYGKNYYPDTFKLAQILDGAKADYGETLYQRAIMHNKFFIFDKQTVLTGSANISPHDLSGYNSNAIIVIKSPEIANIYEQEFNNMYENKFHTAKSKINDTENILIGDSIVSVYFSPQDSTIKSKIIPLINNAKNYIYIPAFVITHYQFTQALIEAKKRGVDVKVILDATNAGNKYSTHDTMRKEGIPVKTENYAGKMHSKSIIIDDHYLIIGSMNFSKSGETANDENVLIIENSSLAKYYNSFFKYVWEKIPDTWLTKNAASESKDSIGSCFDGVDNDFDNLIDLEDTGCAYFKTHKK